MKIRITLLFLAIATIGFAQKKEFKKIEKAVLSQDYEAAAEIFNQLDSGSVEDKYKAHYQIATGVILLKNPYSINVGKKETLEAIDCFNEAKSLSYDGDIPLDLLISNSKQRLIDIAISNADKKEYGKGYEIMTSLYERFPQDTLWLFQAASLAQANGDNKNALNHLEKLVAIGYTGQEVSYYAYSVQTGERVNWTKEAIDAGMKSGILNNAGKEITPSKVADITKMMAVLHAQNGDKEKALGAIKKAMLSNPNDKFLMASEASIYLELEMMKEYRAAFDNLLAANIDELSVYVNLGIKATETNKYEDAVKAFSKALELDPQNYNYATAATQALMKADDAIIEKINGLIKSGSSNSEIVAAKSSRKKNIESIILYAEKAHQIDATKKDIIGVLSYYYGELNNKIKEEEFKTKM